MRVPLRLLVAARRALDRRAGVLRDHQAPVAFRCAGLARHRTGRIDPDRRAVGREGGVDREAALGGDLHALGADRPAGAGVLEEDVALVPAHDVANQRRQGTPLLEYR